VSISRPFYAIGHNPNIIADAVRYLRVGANGFDPDVQVCVDRSDRLCIGHDQGRRDAPTLIKYFEGLHDLAIEYPQLSLVDRGGRDHQGRCRRPDGAHPGTRVRPAGAHGHPAGQPVPDRTTRTGWPSTPPTWPGRARMRTTTFTLRGSLGSSVKTVNTQFINRMERASGTTSRSPAMTSACRFDQCPAR
jgi:hypothetical protein